jgi:hypothetical protein
LTDTAASASAILLQQTVEIWHVFATKKGRFPAELPCGAFCLQFPTTDRSKFETHGSSASVSGSKSVDKWLP